MEKHTPGPWVVSIGPPEHVKYEMHKTRIIPGGERDFIIATAEYGTYGPPMVGEADANARLIAAAPELLEALKAAVRVMKDQNLDEALAGEFEIFEDAIAKAVGR